MSRENSRPPTGPVARRAGLIIEGDREGVLVYDRDCDQAHWLDADAAAVWEACDGHSSAAAVAARCDLSESATSDVLSRLAAINLLDEPPLGTTRRGALRTAAKAATALAAIPTIATIIAPTAAMADSVTCQARSCGTVGNSAAAAKAGSDANCNNATVVGLGICRAASYCNCADYTFVGGQGLQHICSGSGGAFSNAFCVY